MKPVIVAHLPQQELGGTPHTATGFLPDFCDNRAVFLLVIIIELLAFILALANNRTLESFWTDLALAPLFMQWVALTVAAVLCRCQRWLARLPSPVITLVIFGIAQLSTLLYSLLALRLAADVSLGNMNLSNALSVIIAPQAISGIITLLALRYFYIQHQWQQNIQAEARARWRALQARIHPHFLFNTLNTIASLIRRQPDCAEQAVLDLADLLRSALSDHDAITLNEELELTRCYLAIENLRLGERLRIEWQLDSDLPLDLPIPALLLQPLVENAIYHGIQRMPEGGTLTIRIEKQATALQITIANPRPSDHGQSHQPGQCIAQDNIRQRLQLAYETPDPLHIIETLNHYQVSFILPLSVHTTMG